MTGFFRVGLITGAIASSLLAVTLLISAGLPQRADFTGEIIDGQRFAPETGRLAPLFEQSTLAGNSLSLVELRGRPVVLNFWATWCVPCRVEMPVLQRIYEQHANSGLKVIGINLGEPEANIRGWLQDLSLNFDVIVDTDGEITARYYLLGQPSTYVIAPNGRIVGVFHGPAIEDQIIALLEPYL